MRVSFKGPPERVVRDMIKFLEEMGVIKKAHESVHLAPEGDKNQVWPLSTKGADQTIRDIVRDEVNDPCKLPDISGMPLSAPGPSATEILKETVNDVEAPLTGEPGPQSVDARACPYCGKFSKKGGRISNGHRKYCKKNPNREIHPSAGKPTPRLQKGRLKDQSASAPEERPESNSSSPSATNRSERADTTTSGDPASPSTPPTSSGDDVPEMPFDEEPF